MNGKRAKRLRTEAAAGAYNPLRLEMHRKRLYESRRFDRVVGQQPALDERGVQKIDAHGRLLFNNVIRTTHTIRNALNTPRAIYQRLK